MEPNFGKGDGLLPVIVQDVETSDVLMLAYMNQRAWEETRRTGRAVFWSRSRQKIWVKGEVSGHEQSVVEMRLDCDNDTLLLKVLQRGGACHRGYRSCFYRALLRNGVWVAEIDQERLFDPKNVYAK